MSRRAWHAETGRRRPQVVERCDQQSVGDRKRDHDRAWAWAESPGPDRQDHSRQYQTGAYEESKVLGIRESVSEIGRDHGHARGARSPVAGNLETAKAAAHQHEGAEQLIDTTQVQGEALRPWAAVYGYEDP